MIRHPDFRLTSASPAGLRKPSGFTLIELLLVLGILSVMVALSWPRLLATLKMHTLQGNIEQVRQVVDQVRVRAIEEGETLQLRFEPNGRKFVVLPYEVPAQTTETASAAMGASSGTVAPRGLHRDPYQVYQLAEDFHFHIDNALLSGKETLIERLPEAALAQLNNSFLARDVGWSTPILYFPDGSATDQVLVIMDRDRRYFKLSIRGLTGAVTVSPMATMSEKLGETGT